MEYTDVMAGTGGLQAIARELGISDTEAAAGAAALTPAVISGFERRAASEPSGTNDLGDLIQQLGGDSLLDNVIAPEPTDVSRGNSILGQIFGSKDASREVAREAAPLSGLDPSILKKMLPMLAMIVAGHLSRQQKSGGSAAGRGLLGGLGGLLGGILGKR
jgi:hypothetical protein